MAWTYDASQLQSAAPGQYPGSTIGLRYQIRLLLLDNQVARPLLDDFEIDWFITTEMNAFMAAAACCRSLVVRGGSITNKRVGDLSITYDPKFYEDLRLQLTVRGLTYQVPYVGGTRISGKTAEQVDTDAVVPWAFIGFGNNQFANQPSPGASVSSSVNNPNAI